MAKQEEEQHFRDEHSSNNQFRNTSQHFHDIPQHGSISYIIGGIIKGKLKTYVKCKK